MNRRDQDTPTVDKVIFIVAGIFVALILDTVFAIYLLR